MDNYEQLKADNKRLKQENAELKQLNSKLEVIINAQREELDDLYNDLRAI
ncbi:hypothetical protein [Latilactobacillus phage TMW 1.1393 P1]|nr:hypothetical protein [Latilactobacillus phage TMW 1.1393 P1]